jgi:hypothetical protein
MANCDFTDRTPYRYEPCELSYIRHTHHHHGQPEDGPSNHCHIPIPTSCAGLGLRQEDCQWFEKMECFSAESSRTTKHLSPSPGRPILFYEVLPETDPDVPEYQDFHLPTACQGNRGAPALRLVVEPCGREVGVHLSIKTLGGVWRLPGYSRDGFRPMRKRGVDCRSATSA